MKSEMKEGRGSHVNAMRGVDSRDAVGTIVETVVTGDLREKDQIISTKKGLRKEAPAPQLPPPPPLCSRGYGKGEGRVFFYQRDFGSKGLRLAMD